MKRDRSLLNNIRKAMGGYEHWQQDSAKPKLVQFRQQHWAIQCGDTRYDGTKKTAAVAKRSNQAALNFQIRGIAEEIISFEFSVGWLRQPGWLLMLHFDPEQESWPDHPSYHIQFEAGTDDGRLPPFVTWRIPLAEKSPERIHEFLVYHILLDQSPGQ